MPRIKVLKTLLLVSCLTGLAYQTLVISQQYFTYSTASEVTASNSPHKESDIPAVTYCMNSLKILDLGLLKKDFNCSLTQYPDPYKPKKGCFWDTFKGFSLQEKFKYTKRIQPFLSHTKTVNFIDDFDENRKCATSSFSQIERSLRTVGGIWFKGLYSFPNVTSKVFVYLHGRSAPFFDFNEHQYTQIVQERNLRNVITYTLYKTIKPSTPTSPCLDYSENKFFRSNKDCIHQCHKVTGHVTTGTFYNESTDFKPRMFPGIEECYECPKDCVLRMYDFTITPQLVKKHDFDLLIELMDTDPVIEIESSVKLTMVEYIIYIAGCIGLWFGFSIFGTTMEIWMKIIKCWEKSTNRSNRVLIQANIQYNPNFNVNIINNQLIPVTNKITESK